MYSGNVDMDRNMRNVLYLFLIFALTSLVAPLLGAPEPLKKSDIRNTMEEMLSYHIEQREFSPHMIKRSFKLFIEQFDPYKNYLLYHEVKPYLELANEEIEGVIDGYAVDEFSLYQKLNGVIGKAIERAKAFREEIKKELVLEESFSCINMEDSSYQFPATADVLKNRIRNQLIRLLQAEMKASGAVNWNAQKKMKIFNLFEKKYSRFENTYLPGKAKSEHFFATHILKALSKSMDAHTSFFSPEEAFEMRASLEKQFEGLGLVLKESIEGVIIVDLIAGSPAFRSGKILAGDLLVEVNGISTQDRLYEEILGWLNEKKETSLVFERPGAEGQKKVVAVDLTREKIVMKEERLSWEAEPFGDGIIGKITLPSFYESSSASSCEADIREALKQLKKQGKLTGLVLDMRENLGGFLTQAVKVAGLFITSGVVVVSRYAQSEIQYMRNVDPRVYYNGPFVILTSKSSASAAEIVAQALQDYGVALVVGDERTYGKGTIQYQTVTDETASSFFKVTVGKYYTVSGKSTQIEGVKADIIVPTEYSPYNIGERYLEYPLSNDRVPAVYVDPLTDVDMQAKMWLQKNYLPYIQKRESVWNQMLSRLQSNSSLRLKNDQNYQTFLSQIALLSSQRNQTWGMKDLPMEEAVNVIKDMAVMSLVKKSDE